MSQSLTRPTREGKGLPVLPSRMALIELGVLIAVILLERFVEPFPDLSRMNPHPYWIFVLLLSLQYGTVSGLLAAVVAIGGTLAIGLPEADIGESYFEYLIRVWTQPVLWLVMALMLGSFRMKQIEFRDDLMREVDDLQARGVALVDHAKHLKARCDALERELVSSSDPEGFRVLDAVARLTQVSQTDGEMAFREAMTLAFPRAQASVFLVGAEGWHAIWTSGWPESAAWKTSFARSDALVAAMLEKRSLSILAADDEAALLGEGQFAVPIVSLDGLSVNGFIKIESLPASAISVSTVVRLMLLSRQLSASLATGDDTAADPPYHASEAPKPTSPVSQGPVSQGLAAAIRYLPRIRWASKARHGVASDSPAADTSTAVADDAPRTFVRRT